MKVKHISLFKVENLIHKLKSIFSGSADVSANSGKVAKIGLENSRSICHGKGEQVTWLLLRSCADPG